MTIDDTTTISTPELCRLLNCSRGHLSHLETGGIIARTDRNVWPLMQTVRAIVGDMRERGSAATEARAKLLVTQERLAQLRLAREAHAVCDVEETNAVVSQVAALAVNALETVTGTPRARADQDLRDELQSWATMQRRRVADTLVDMIEHMRQTGRAPSDLWGAAK
jgi:hypothetical protein